ncbi:MAG: hypothetical protein ACYSU7_08335 [Planctomycetota bacterium]
MTASVQGLFIPACLGMLLSSSIVLADARELLPATDATKAAGVILIDNAPAFLGRGGTAGGNGECSWDNGPPADCFGAPASQEAGAFPFYAEAADDFILTGDGGNPCLITQVTVWITFFNVPAPPAADPTGYFVTIYPDAGGIPGGEPVAGGGHAGAVVADQFVAAGDAVVTPLAFPVIGDVRRVDLPVELVVPKNEVLWLAVAPQQDFASQGQTAIVLSQINQGLPSVQIFPEAGIPVWTLIAGNAACDPPFPDGTLTDLAFVIVGQKIPPPDCPWDCDGSNDGIVGILDFLAMLAQWGVVGAPCDFDGGGVGITDFLKLLAQWGPCSTGVKCCLPIDLEAYCANPDADPPEACVDAASCDECAAMGGLCVDVCNVVEQTITVVNEDAPSGSERHSTWTALVCAPKAPCVCGNLIDGLFTPATPCAAGEGSFANFGVGEIPPIPADFFAPGSDPFVGQICLKGEPLGATPFGVYDVADTLVRRSQDPFDCSSPPGETVIEIEIIELSLRSIDPIVVTFNGGQNPELWDVDVHLSQLPQQQGQMQIQKTHANGGTYDSFLPVLPSFRFEKVDNPGDIRVLDAGIEGLPPISLFGVGDWVHDVKLNTLAPEGPPSCFNPGIREDNP